MNQEPRKVITIPAKPELAQAKTARRQLRVAIYCRVATADQLALDAQIEHLKKYAVERNMDIVKIYCDMGPAGKNQGYIQRLLRDAECRIFKKILVLKPSRLARRTDMLLDITARLRRAGVAVEYADGSTPMLELMENVMETLDAQLLKAAVSAVQIQGNAVSIRLKNDQIIRKKDEL
jgi:DNA invertase Pin-like site-specific DNA recombinase